MSLTRECPSCHRVNRASSRACEECGVDFVTGRPGRPARLKGGEPQMGVFALALGTIVHPVRTMDSFFYYVSDTAMLGRMFVFYLVSLPIAGFIAGGSEARTWVQGTFAEAAGFLVSTFCILGAGRLLSPPPIWSALGVIPRIRPGRRLVRPGTVRARHRDRGSWAQLHRLHHLHDLEPGAQHRGPDQHLRLLGTVAVFISIIGGILQGIITRAIGIST
jgi:hypothetical protein